MDNVRQSAAVYSVGGWVRTPQGWKILTNTQDAPVELRNNNARNREIRSRPRSTNREPLNTRIVLVTGCHNQRRVSVCLSEFIDNMDLLGAASDQRRQAFLCQIMHELMKTYLYKISGTAHMKLFRILDAMVNDAISRELNIQKMTDILMVTVNTLKKGSLGVGCRSVWKRHLDNALNLQTKIQNFSYTQRTDSGLTLTDLPEECLYDIMSRLTDHRDLVHLGATCKTLYTMTRSEYIWESLTVYHFTEKQMLTFLSDLDDSAEMPHFMQLFDKCYRKYGLTSTFADQLAVCSGCHSLQWLMLGQNCWRNCEADEIKPYMETLSPSDVLGILPL